MAFSNYLAVKTSDPESLFDRLNPMDFHKKSWRDVVKPVPESDHLFITRPLNGYTLLTGDYAVLLEKILPEPIPKTDPGQADIPDRWQMFLGKLLTMSRQYVSVQYYQIWEGYLYEYAIVESGKLLRVYSLDLGNGGHFEFGDPSPLELRFGFIFNEELFEQRDQGVSTKDGIRHLAAQWSINPDDLEAKYGPLENEFGGWLYGSKSESLRSTQEWLINWRKGLKEALGIESKNEHGW